MGKVGRVPAWVQLFGKAEEWPRVAGKVGRVEHCSGVRQTVLLKVIIETSSRSPVGVGEVELDPFEART